MTQALYRRYRPQTFTDVIGQEHVTEPLQQALAGGRVGHAYLFSGPRGCGKTTSARILARCLNCEQGPTPEPCGECPSCVALARGGTGSVDVIEIDAASHGGVDDARDLREKAAYGPAQSRYRVFIIDEAHMVTPQGFNALLKIVEEPPEHVKFIFATTEPEKVIGTIRSRTHHYPFRLVPPARLHDYLGEVCVSEGVEVEPGVLSFVVRAGGGSVRDSLSVLDQLMAGSTGTLTYAGAAALLGFTEGELLDATVDAVAARDGASVFRQIDKVIETGHDPRRFVEDLLERFRDLIIVSAVGSNTDESLTAVLRGLPDDQIDRLRQQASAFGAGELSHAADVTNAGLTAMTGATAPRLQLELLCARLLLPRMAGEDGMIARVDRLERRLEMGGPPPPASQPRGARDAAAPVAPAPEASRSATPGPEVEQPQPRARDEVGARRGAQPSGSDSAGPGSREEAPSHRAGDAGSAGPHQDRGTQRSHGSRHDAVEHRPEAGRHGGSGQAPASPAAEPQVPAARAAAPGGIDTDAIRRAWPDVLATIFTIRRATWTFLSQHSQVLDYDGQRLLLGISSRGLARTFQQGQHAEVVRQALIDSRGVDCRVEGVALDDAPPSGGASGPSGGTPSAPGGDGPRTGPGRGGAPAPAGPQADSQTGPPPTNNRAPAQHERPRQSADGRRGDERSGARRPGVDSGGEGSRREGASARPGRARGSAPAQQVPPDLPEPPDYDAPPEFDEPHDLYEPTSPASPRREVSRREAPRREQPRGGQPPRREESSAPSATAPQAPTPPRQQAQPEDRHQSQPEARQEPRPGAPAEPAAQPQPQPSPQPSPQTQPSPQAPPGATSGGRRPGSGHEAFRAAMAARRSQQRAAPESEGGPGNGRVAGESARRNGSGGGGDDSAPEPSASGVSADDEDISDLSQVGKPVIAEVLGGVVIDETEE